MHRVHVDVSGTTTFHSNVISETALLLHRLGTVRLSQLCSHVVRSHAGYPVMSWISVNYFELACPCNRVYRKDAAEFLAFGYVSPEVLRDRARFVSLPLLG